MVCSKFTWLQASSRDVILYVMFLVLVGASVAEERVNLVQGFQPSPDGNHLVFLSERRHNDSRDFTLTLLTNKRMTNRGSNEYTLVYSLTPRIQEIVLAPDGHLIAYIAKDFYLWMGIYLWDDGRVRGLEYSGTRSAIEKLQFSEDQKYMRYYTRPSMGISKLWGEWVVVGDTGHHVVDKTEIDKIHWQSPTQPEQLPPFLNQSLPVIQADTEIEWAPDSQSLYLFDNTGLWRCELGDPFVCQWTQLVENTSIMGLRLSPQGTHVIYICSGDSIEHDIQLLDLAEMTLRPLGQGWSPCFSRDGQRIFYGSLTGLHQMSLDGTGRVLHHASYRP